MQIQFNTDHNIEGGEGLAAYVDGIVDKALSPVSDHITRVEVHLSDESSNKSTPNHKRCVMEARLEGRQPIVVTHEASTVDEAVIGAANKLTRRVDHVIGRLRRLASRRFDPAPDAPETAVRSFD
jgi:ribosome-associated translation inhibitor RaiA